jgi:methyl-accepting chemotaxis protein
MVLVVLALAVSASAAVAIYLGSPLEMGISLAAVVLCASLVLVTARTSTPEARVLGKVTQVCKKVSAGDFEARIINVEGSGDIVELQHAINDLIDNCDSYVRESAASLDAVAHGRFYRRILLQGMHGSFRSAAVTINKAIEASKTSEEARRSAAKLQVDMVAALARGLGQLAQGDLTCRIGDIPPGFEQVRDDFNRAMDQLERTLQGVTNRSAAMNAGSREIATASSDLSRRTEQQAANLEKTASALNELTATVKRTAEGAAYARDVVGSTRLEAEKSGEVMRKAVDAMGSIEKSSSRIGEIIGLIDEIAFQTNLLALNAGVEAARAAEAGRGFAVVASEVRALAQRSADAAREIKELISASATQVAHGASLVTETGKSLENILARFGEINTVVNTIAEGAQEQANGLNQVNAAIAQMDKFTQQNAAMAEQATAASTSLAQSSDALASLIDVFKLHAHSEAGRTQARVRLPAA